MRAFLITLFLLIIVGMTIVTGWAMSTRSVFDNGHLMRDPWFVATLCDAYFGFLTFAVWVMYRETSLLSRTVWFIAIMLLGNFAMAAYMLRQLFALEEDQPVIAILTRSGSSD